jgi:tetraacyldisaccharide 4'-kinase
MEERGLRTAVLYRGYKREESGPAVIECGEYSRSGDEPCMVSRWSARAKVFVHRERYRAGIAAMEVYSPDLFLLDDGFQHVSLKRDLDIVLIDSSNPFDNGRLFPFGLLREPISSLSRAHLVVLTRCNQSDIDKAVETIVNEAAPGVPVARGIHAPDSLLSIEGETSRSCALRGKRVLAFSGIGNNSSFLLSAMESGAEMVGVEEYTDHHAYSRRDLIRMEKRAKTLGAEWLLTTEKDMVRIPRMKLSLPVYALTVKMVLVSGAEHLESKLERLLRCACSREALP